MEPGLRPWRYLPLAVCVVGLHSACERPVAPPAATSNADEAERTCKKPRDHSRNDGTSTPALHMRGGEEIDANTYPNVGMLYFADVKNQFFIPIGRETQSCTATLVCGDVVLTAAHCFGPTPAPEKYTFHQDAYPGDRPLENAIAAQKDLGSDGGLTVPTLGQTPPTSVLANRQPPALAKPNGKLGAAPTTIPEVDIARGVEVRTLGDGSVGMLDLALLKLDRRLTSTPTPIAGGELLTAEKEEEGPLLTMVGYGTTATVNGQDVRGGIKKMGDMRLTRYMNTPDNEALNALGALYPRQGLDAPTTETINACPGDSGGPVMFDGRIVGIVSRIMEFRNGEFLPSPSCQDSNISFFTRTQQQKQWLRLTLTELCSDRAYEAGLDDVTVLKGSQSAANTPAGHGASGPTSGKSDCD